VPNTVSTRLSVAGVAQGAELFTSAAGLSEASDETIRQAVGCDAAPFATGSYRTLLTIANNFALTTVSRTKGGTVLINNEQASPFGAGWTLDGLQRLRLQNDGSTVLTSGDGGVMRFEPIPVVGDFTAPQSFGPVLATPRTLWLDDFDNDGDPDIVVPDSSNDQLVVLLNDGLGGFSNLQVLPSGGDDPRAAGSGNFDGGNLAWPRPWPPGSASTASPGCSTATAWAASPRR